MSNVQSELAKVLKLKQKDGEDLDAYARRLAVAANKIPDDAWETLSEPAQLWVNAALKAIEKKEELPVLSNNGDTAEAMSSEKEADPGEAAEGTKQGAPAQSEESDVATKSVKSSTKKKVAVAKPKKAVATKAPAKVKGAGVTGESHRGPKPKFAADAKIKLLVKENPHNEGSGRYKRWLKYKDGMTVAEAIKAGLKYVNLRYSVSDGHIKIS